MWNFFTDKKQWMVASLLGASSIFAQNCKPVCEPVCCEPHELLQCPTVAAYNAPSSIDIQCGWDVWVDASFVYWQPLQSNMEAGTEHNTPVVTTLGPNNFRPVNMDFKFKPGFKVGLGMTFDYDKWDASLEYTWFHCKQNRSGSTSTAAATGGAGYLPNWLFSTNAALLANSITAFNSSWQLDLDFLDMALGRSYYVGTQLTYRPSIGARVAWINQKREVTYTDILSTPLAATNFAKSTSWAIGPRVTLDMNWMIGWGFRFFGNNAFDLLFTRYKTINNSQNTSSGAVTLLTDFNNSNINTIRPHVDLEWGMGWGTYLCNHEWHVDIAASYGFQVFWNQNMFRFSSGTSAPRTYSPTGDLYVHGLTLTAKLDF